MKYLVKTYKPLEIRSFKNIKQAKGFIFKYAFLNNIDLGTLEIDTKTISFQVTNGNEPKIRFERNPITFN